MEAMTYSEFIRKTSNELTNIYCESEANSISKMLAQDLFKADNTSLIIQNSIILDPDIKEKYWNYISLLKRGVPVQYVLGYSFFYGYRFNIENGVLIPRQETEELVDWIIKDHKKEESLSILEVGTGSGIIAIILAMELLKPKIMGIDISEKAIEVTNSNIQKFKLKNISVEKQDLFDFKSNIMFDIIVSNPPYVREFEKRLMESLVLEHEPHQALFVNDDNPLVYYEAILKLAQINLCSGGVGYFEINESLGNELESMITNLGFKMDALRRDINNKPRMIRFYK
ncbi:MAG: peptide chain release factor N(5)-glutamine methyltransferase [Marinilabiliales bacterium]|mgnify:CR=1 FL=1|nr:MAG: peptide chain release factor N(5)-glutamine methyltransferase [Marinilabiliales bacterium]